MSMVGAGVDVDAVHRDPWDAFHQHMVIPTRVSRDPTENQLYAAVQFLQRFRPLHGPGGVDFFGYLLDLPVAPHLVTKAPVFDL